MNDDPLSDEACNKLAYNSLIYCPEDFIRGWKSCARRAKEIVDTEKTFEEHSEFKRREAEEENKKLRELLRHLLEIDLEEIGLRIPVTEEQFSMGYFSKEYEQLIRDCQKALEGEE